MAFRLPVGGNIVSLFGQIFSFFRRKAIPSAIEDELEERRLHPRINPKEATRILVIDDSPTILTAMKRFIESAHCVFLGAIDAKMGMEVALTQKPDMIFLDIVMPGINGFAALRALRKNARTQDIPIVMMSGNEQAKAQFFGAHIGADDFMKKPFSRFEVFAHIARLLDADCVPRRPPLELPYNSPPVTPEAAPVQAAPRRDEAPAHAERPPDPEKYAVSPEKAARASTAPKAPVQKAAASKAPAVAARKEAAPPPKAAARKAAAPQPKPPAANVAPAAEVHPRSPAAPVQAGPA
ncbi:MAG: response regulator, partial [Azoarcus sp.]|nr:response regulator [Azoarcus sp.]